MICNRCYNKLFELLDDIRAGYRALDCTPRSTGGDGSGPLGFGSKPPADLHVICMLDPRSSGAAQEWTGGDGKVHHEPHNPPLSVFGALHAWVAWIAGERGLSGSLPGDVPELTHWLARHLDWLVRRPEVREFNLALRRLDGQLKLVTQGPAGSSWICRCPHCGHKLRPPNRDGEVRCPPCNRVWPRERWVELGAQRAAVA
jgi:hypothetical protein